MQSSARNIKRESGQTDRNRSIASDLGVVPALLGLRYDPAPVRAARLGEGLQKMKRAWAGQVMLGAGDQAHRAAPALAQAPHPAIHIGGHGDTILTLAAAEADVIGFTGVTWRKDRLVPSGVTADAIAERVSFVRAAAGDRHPELEAMAPVVARLARR